MKGTSSEIQRNSQRGISIVNVLIAMLLMGALVAGVSRFMSMSSKTAAIHKAAFERDSLVSKIKDALNSPAALRATAEFASNSLLRDCVGTAPNGAPTGTPCKAKTETHFVLKSPFGESLTGTTAAPVSFTLDGSPCGAVAPTVKCPMIASTTYLAMCDASDTVLTCNKSIALRIAYTVKQADGIVMPGTTQKLDERTGYLDIDPLKFYAAAPAAPASTPGSYNGPAMSAPGSPWGLKTATKASYTVPAGKSLTVLGMGSSCEMEATANGDYGTRELMQPISVAEGESVHFRGGIGPGDCAVYGTLIDYTDHGRGNLVGKPGKPWMNPVSNSTNRTNFAVPVGKALILTSPDCVVNSVVIPYSPSSPKYSHPMVIKGGQTISTNCKAGYIVDDN